MRNLNKGFTLLEVLVACAILVVAVLSLWAVYITSLNCVIQAREMNIAAFDLKDVLEKIKSVAFADVTTVFPDGAAVNPSLIGGFLLNNENVVVSYPQGITDPLEIQVAITWTGKDLRPYSKTLKTIRTSML